MELAQALDKMVNKLYGWIEALVVMLPNIGFALLALALFVLLARLARWLLGRLIARFGGHSTLNRLITSTVSLAILALGLMVALSILQLDKAVFSLLAGVGVLGLALGFAFQDIAGNFMAGVLIALRHPYRVGDIIETKGYFGKVSGIDLRNTIVRTWSGQDVLVPNKEAFQSPLVNYSRSPDRRVELTVGVSYGEELEQVRQVTLAAVGELPGLDSSRELELFFTEFSDSAITFELRFWLETPEERDYLLARSAAIMAIKRAYDEHGITIPFPIRTLDFGIKGGKTLAQVWPRGVAAARKQ